MALTDYFFYTCDWAYVTTAVPIPSQLTRVAKRNSSSKPVHFDRDVARKKDSFVRSCAEAAIAFGLERDSLARFIPVANATEMALTKEQEVLNEALEALRRNSRRYGMIHTLKKDMFFSQRLAQRELCEICFSFYRSSSGTIALFGGGCW